MAGLFARPCPGAIATARENGAGNVDEVAHQPLSSRVMDLRKTHGRQIHTLIQQFLAGALGSDAWIFMPKVENIFAGQLAWSRNAHADPGGDEHGTIRTGKCLAERGNRRRILAAVRLIIREVMVEGQMDHRIGSFRAAGQAGGIL